MGSRLSIRQRRMAREDAIGGGGGEGNQSIIRYRLYELGTRKSSSRRHRGDFGGNMKELIEAINREMMPPEEGTIGTVWNNALKRAVSIIRQLHADHNEDILEMVKPSEICDNVGALNRKDGVTLNDEAGYSPAVAESLTVQPDEVTIDDCPACMHKKLSRQCRELGLDPENMLRKPERESVGADNQIRRIKHILANEDTYDECVRKIENVLSYHPSVPISAKIEGEK
jgi:hypothetical protein